MYQNEFNTTSAGVNVYAFDLPK